MPAKPPKGKPIQPGERRNPKGSSATARTRAAAKRLVKELSKTMSPMDVAQLITPIVLGTTESVNGLLKKEDLSNGQKYAAKLWKHGYDSNNLTVFKTLIEMVVGKPKEHSTVALTGGDGGPVRSITSAQSMTAEELQAELAAVRARRKASEQTK